MKKSLKEKDPTFFLKPILKIQIRRMSKECDIHPTWVMTQLRFKPQLS